MAIQKEIWAEVIMEELNTSLDPVRLTSMELSDYVDGKTIYIPNAGTTTVVKNNTTWPLTATERADTIATIQVDTYHWAPIILKQADKLQLSYDKLASLYNSLNGGLSHRLVVESWISYYHYTSGAYVNTSGGAYTAHAPGATGNRKGLTGQDIRLAAAILDKQKVPLSDRYLIVDSQMFWQLVDDLSYNADRVDVIQGLPAITTPLYGFVVVSVPQVVYVTNAGAARAYGNAGAATDNAAALAVQKSMVGYALSGVEVFVDENNPLYQGDVISGWAAHGAGILRTDKAGVVPIIQATV